MAVISISLPDTLLREADRFLDARGYAGRSELARAALRDFLAREAGPAAGGERSATVTVQYPDTYGRKISDIRHEFADVVQSMMHGHTETACVEVFLVHGDAARVRAFGDALRAARETQLVQLVYTDAGQAEGGAQRSAHRHH